jgi:hypothetical protein
MIFWHIYKGIKWKKFSVINVKSKLASESNFFSTGALNEKHSKTPLDWRRDRYDNNIKPSHNLGKGSVSRKQTPQNAISASD